MAKSKKYIADQLPIVESDPCVPSVGLLIKLGSIAVHTSELLSPTGNPEFDLSPIRTLLEDPEVVAWVAEMTKLAFLPVKR